MRLRKQINHYSLILFCFLSWVSAEQDDGGHRNEDYDSAPQKNLAYSNAPQDRKPNGSPNAIFPKFLDLRSLQNMPLVIIRPKIPVKLHLLPSQNFGNVQHPPSPGRNPKSLDQGTSYTESNLRIQPKPLNHDQIRSLRPTYTESMHLDVRPNFSHQKTAKYGMVGPHQFQQPQNLQHGGWVNRIRGSITNFLPRMNAFHRPPMLFAAPTITHPVFPPNYGNFHPFAAAVNRPIFVPPFHTPIPRSPLYYPFIQQNPSGFGMDDLTAFASNRLPIGAMHPSMMRPHPLMSHPGMNFYEGGDLAASASGPVPVSILPPPSIQQSASAMFPSKAFPSIKNNQFANYASKFPRHRPLFNNVEGLEVTNMEINNAFADFADSPDHGHDVNQRFGAVGDSINKFLQMMGLGTSGFTNPEIGAFGGAGELAALESTPISRSFDYFPGYGNQAHLDHIDDEEIFEEDITDIFNKKFKKPPTTTMPPSYTETKKTTIEDKKTTVAMKPTNPPVIKSTQQQRIIPTFMHIPTVKFDSSDEMQENQMIMKPGKTITGKSTPAYLPTTINPNTSNTKAPDMQKPPKSEDVQSNSQMEVTHPKIKDLKVPPLGATKFYYSDYLKNQRPEKSGSNDQNVNSTPCVQAKDNQYAQAHTMADGSQTTNEKYQTSAPNQNSEEIRQPNEVLYPSVNYNIPSTHHTASPEDTKPPVLIYQNLPPAQLHHGHAVITIENRQKPATDDHQQPTYASAHALPGINHVSEESAKHVENEQTRWSLVPMRQR